MSGFIYKNKSTDTILESTRLILVSFSQLESITGSSRESVVGNSTLTRQFPNEYGTMSSALTFNYALIKSDKTPFTVEEQIEVERWLSSPKYSSKLQIIDCDGIEDTLYYGKFIKTDWYPCVGGWYGVAFTFENKHAYPHRHFEHTFNINGNDTITFNCQSDELEEYIYPIVMITAQDSTEELTITNRTDNNNSISMRCLDRIENVMDCNLCMLYDRGNKNLIGFDDVGWSDVGNIYWIRLVPGENIFDITGATGTVQITFSYDAPYKKVGGWL